MSFINIFYYICIIKTRVYTECHLYKDTYKKLLAMLLLSI